MRLWKRKDKPGKPRRRIRKLRLFTLILVFGILGFGAFVFGVVTAIAEEIPKLDPAYQQRISKNSYVYSADGKRVLAVIRGAESRVIVPLRDIAPVMKQAIVSIEDRRFFEHGGVDIRAIFRAVWADVTSGNVVQGGSTITQQFIKNAYVHSAPSISRKLKEAALAWQLEQRWSKDRILTAYLNTIYFGNGAYGIQQAAQTYFQHSAKALTLPEAALLAGIPQDPTLYDPVTNPKQAAGRRGQVLREMYQQGDITADELHVANSAALPPADSVHLPGTTGPAQYFVNYIKQQLVDRCGSSQVFGGGLKVTTTIDLGLQQLAQQAISKWLTSPGSPSAALVAIDPRNGEVKAMIGGNNFRKSQFNLAVQGERQPGSSFKPFVLATALEDGISPVTEFESKPVQIFTGDRIWVVHNYEGSYIGRAEPRDRDHVLRQLDLRAADRPGRSGLGCEDRPRDGHHQPAQALPLDRPRRAGGEPAGDGPRLLHLRQRRVPDRRRDHRQSRARDRRDRRGRLARLQRRQQGGREAHHQPDHREDRDSLLQSVVTQGQACALSSRTVARSPARRARRRTTATPGSSGTRPSWSPRFGSVTRTT